MLGKAIRLYRCKHELSQQQLAKQVLLNQRDISDLETEKPDAIKRFEVESRFSELRDLMRRVSQEEPITLFRRSCFPSTSTQIPTQSEWIAIVPSSQSEDCGRLFEGRDVAIVVQN